MKRIAAVLLAIVMCFALIGCSNSSKPQKTLDAFMNALKALDAEEMAKYTPLDAGSFSNLKDETFDLTLLTRKMQYKVNSCKVEGEKAEAELTVSNVDMMEVMKKFAADLLSFYISGNKIAEGEEYETYNNMMAEIIDSDIQRYSKDIKLELSLKDGVWQIDNSQELLDPALGGLLSYDFSNIF